MLGCVGAEGVRGEELFGISVELKLLSRDDEVSVASHRAIGAVALPDDNAGRGFDFPSNSLAMASTTVHDNLRVHY